MTSPQTDLLSPSVSRDSESNLQWFQKEKPITTLSGWRWGGGWGIGGFQSTAGTQDPGQGRLNFAQGQSKKLQS